MQVLMRARVPTGWLSTKVPCASACGTLHDLQLVHALLMPTMSVLVQP